MTHPPPDPEGRQDSEESLRRLRERRLRERYPWASATCPYCRTRFESGPAAATMQEAESAVLRHAERHALTCTGRGVREERLRLAARLDVALAARDAGEAGAGAEGRMTRRKQLRWRKEPRETGLAGVVQGPLGAELRYGDEVVATVSALRAGWERVYRGWYWVARDDTLGIPLRNTCREPVATLEEAKAAEAYARECLRGRAGGAGGGRMKASELIAHMETGRMCVTGHPDRITYLELSNGYPYAYGWGSALCAGIAWIERLLKKPEEWAPLDCPPEMRGPEVDEVAAAAIRALKGPEE